MTEGTPSIRLKTSRGFLLARDGLHLCFFMRRSHEDIAPSVWRAIQLYLEAIPPRSLGWSVTPEGAFLRLDEDRWRGVREELLVPPYPASLLINLQQHQDEAGGYNIEYVGRRLEAPAFVRDENSTCAVSFTLPTEYLEEHGATRVRALALSIAQQLPFSFGYASLALISPNTWWYAARRAVRELRDRHPGLDVCILEQTSRVMGTRARGAYWLTFLGEPLLARLGGVQQLRRRLSFPDITLQPLAEERVLVSVGDEPDAFDTERRRPPPSLRALAQTLEPFLLEEEPTGWFIPDDLEDMRRWARRFCP